MGSLLGPLFDPVLGKSDVIYHVPGFRGLQKGVQKRASGDHFFLKPGSLFDHFLTQKVTHFGAKSEPKLTIYGFKMGVPLDQKGGHFLTTF